jgi:tRNA uridine 5-carboxymethylaminomethyl modification enzyme
MFTSRAEYRLSLREDNADLRLTETGRELGLVDDARWDAYCRKRDAIAAESERLKSVWINPRLLPAGVAERVLGKPTERENELSPDRVLASPATGDAKLKRSGPSQYRLFDLLRRPEVSYRSLLTLPGAGEPVADPQVAEQVEIQAKYAGYIERQREDVAKAQDAETLRIPPELDYGAVHGLSIEVRQRLAQHRPETLGQASRVQGVTPAAMSLLLVHLKKRGKSA